MSATVATPRPHVLIVGAGLGGLLLGGLLERCNIPYEIFERASSVKPLGKTAYLCIECSITSICSGIRIKMMTPLPTITYLPLSLLFFLLGKKDLR